jgi:hypothetical protein
MVSSPIRSTAARRGHARSHVGEGGHAGKAGIARQAQSVILYFDVYYGKAAYKIILKIILIASEPTARLSDSMQGTIPSSASKAILKPIYVAGMLPQYCSQNLKRNARLRHVDLLEGAVFKEDEKRSCTMHLPCKDNIPRYTPHMTPGRIM